ncbi:MAG: ubiquitin [Oscillospiraceae bacterium]|nr:ubiquitin [Oscillospiraceae bacterium]
MTQLKKVEKLREKTNVSYEDAKLALDNSGGDLLDAIIYLEREGKISAPVSGGEHSGAERQTHADETAQDSTQETSSSNSGEAFADLIKRFGAFCLKVFNKGLSNFLEASKGDQHLFSCPVLVFALLIIFFFWITIPLFVISLFCGFRYRFTGKDLGNDAVNNVMDNASSVVEEVKQGFTGNSNNNNSQD